MAFDLATYGSSIFSPTPSNILPEPGDDLSYDWMDIVGLFSQRFRRMATVIATIADSGSYYFNYSALRCDYFPPILQAYYFDNAGTMWHSYTNDLGTFGVNRTAEWYHVGLGTAMFWNRTGQSRAWMMIAYL